MTRLDVTQPTPSTYMFRRKETPSVRIVSYVFICAIISPVVVGALFNVPQNKAEIGFAVILLSLFIIGILYILQALVLGYWLGRCWFLFDLDGDEIKRFGERIGRISEIERLTIRTINARFNNKFQSAAMLSDRYLLTVQLESGSRLHIGHSHQYELIESAAQEIANRASIKVERF